MPMEGTIAIVSNSGSNFGDRKGEVIFIPVPGYYTVYTYIHITTMGFALLISILQSLKLWGVMCVWREIQFGERSCLRILSHK